MKSAAPTQQQELTKLCKDAKLLVEEEKYEECKRLVSNAMGTFPRAPQPHNLMGILLEQENGILGVMRHFRSAWTLDPTYLPAWYNSDRLGGLTPDRKYAYGESDYGEPLHLAFRTRWDPNGIIYIVEQRAEQ